MNRKHHRRIAASIIGTICVLSPALVFAQTATSSVSDIQAQIKALLAQLDSLRNQLSILHGTTTPPFGRGDDQRGTTTPPVFRPLPPQGTSTPPMPPQQGCPNISRNLGVGSRGDDVRTLQQQLSQDPSILPQSGVTGVFGTSTREAVMRLQQRFGVASSTGFFGAITRELFGRRCGELQNSDNTNSKGSGRMDDRRDDRPFMGTSTTPGMFPPALSGSTTPQNLQFLEDGNHGGWHGSVPPWQGQSQQGQDDSRGGQQSSPPRH